MDPKEFIDLFAPKPPEPPTAPKYYDAIKDQKNTRITGEAYDAYGEGGLEQALADLLDNPWDCSSDTYGLAVEIMSGNRPINGLTQSDWSKLDELVVGDKAGGDGASVSDRTNRSRVSPAAPGDNPGFDKDAEFDSPLRQVLGRTRRVLPQEGSKLSLGKQLQLRSRTPDKGPGTPDRSPELSWWSDGSSGLTDPHK